MERILVSRRLAETYHDGDGAYLHDGRSARKFLRCRQCARNRNAVIQGGRIHSVECRLLLGSQHVRRTWRPKSGDMVIRPDAPQRSRNHRRPRCQLRAMRSRHRITAVANIPALPVTPSSIGRGGLQSSGKSTKHGSEHKNICIFEFLYYLCTRNEQNGALVQLVRIRACHARGQGFESPTHRQQTEGEIPGGKEQETRQFTTASFFVSPHRMAVRTGKGKADKGTSTSIREGVRLPEQREGSRRKESPQGHLPYGSGKGKQ